MRSQLSRSETAEVERVDSLAAQLVQHLLQRQAHAIPVRGPRGQPQGQQRVAADIEETFVRGGDCDAHQFAHDRGDPAFGIRTARTAAGGGQEPGFGQQGDIQFAHRGERDLVEAGA